LLFIFLRPEMSGWLTNLRMIHCEYADEPYIARYDELHSNLYEFLTSITHIANN